MSVSSCSAITNAEAVKTRATIPRGELLPFPGTKATDFHSYFTLVDPPILVVRLKASDLHLGITS
jgi:hypothetical protein